MNATVVAFHGGGRPAPLAALVTRLQALLAGDGFRPRPVSDVHATVIGLERDGVDVAGLCRHLGTELAAPLTVRFGGFPPGPRYERSLTARPDKIVLIGWPVDAAGEPTDRLDVLRRDLARFGARHRYGADPDCYLVLGDVQPGAVLVDRVAAGRAELAASPCVVRLGAAEVAVARYTDPRLPAGTTEVVPLLAAGGGGLQRGDPAPI